MYGAVIHYLKLGFSEPNVEGCIAFVGKDSTASSCGARVEAARDCALAACGSVCPIHSASDFAALQQCRDDSSSVCSTYVSAASCANGSNYLGCAQQSYPSQDAWTRAIIDALCGSGTL
jgi:hypothetical protein